MSNNFNLKKFLVENNLTENSRRMLGKAAAQELVDAARNGVPLPEFIAAVVTAAAGQLDGDGYFHGGDHGTKQILYAIGREDLLADNGF